MMTYASEDVTYCQNDKCVNKCWRYAGNYRFKEKGLYWFMEKCKRECIKKIELPKNKVIARDYVEKNYIPKYKIDEILMTYYDIIPKNVQKELKNLTKDKERGDKHETI